MREVELRILMVNEVLKLAYCAIISCGEMKWINLN